MSNSGGQLGNNNAGDGKAWKSAIRRAIAHRHGDYSTGLFNIAAKLVEAAENGDMWALKEIGDREDGKAAQGVEVTGKDGKDLIPEPSSDTELARRLAFLLTKGNT